MAIMIRSPARKQEQIEHYRQQAVDLGIAGKVTFTGMVSPTDIPSFIEAAIFIHHPALQRHQYTAKDLWVHADRARESGDRPADPHANRTTEHFPSCRPRSQSFAGGLVRVLQDREGVRETLAKAAIERADEHFSE